MLQDTPGATTATLYCCVIVDNLPTFHFRFLAYASLLSDWTTGRNLQTQLFRTERNGCYHLKVVSPFLSMELAKAFTVMIELVDFLGYLVYRAVRV